MRRSLNKMAPWTGLSQSISPQLLMSWLCGVGQHWSFTVEEPIILGPMQQLTRFGCSKQLPNDSRLTETGDHLIAAYDAYVFHNMLMQMRRKPDGHGRANHGLSFEGNETEEAYLKRVCDDTLKNYAHSLTLRPDAKCIAIQEGVVKKEHIELFKQAIQKHLPGWVLIGGTPFGLWFIVREKLASQYKVDTQIPSTLKEKKLDDRLLTLVVNPNLKISNIHVPEGGSVSQKSSEKYQEIAIEIIRDLVKQANPSPSNHLYLKLLHVVSDNEHMKDGGTRLVSVSGVTEFTLRCGDKIFTHKVMGDFNLELDERQASDEVLFKKVKDEFKQNTWSTFTIGKKTKYIAGIIIGGTVTMSTDIIGLDMEVFSISGLMTKIGTFGAYKWLQSNRKEKTTASDYTPPKPVEFM